MWTEVERDRVVRLCARITGDRQVAEDLAQETLLEAWRHGHKLRDREGADRWLSAVARNVCLRYGRRRAAAAVPLEDVPEVAAPPASSGELTELLELLPQSGREVLMLRYGLDWSLAEIASRLALSEDAVSMRLARAKVALRRLLDDEEWRPTGIWCACCGGHKLLVRRDHAGAAISFRCVGCDPEGFSAVFPLDNPLFARLVGTLERPSAMFGRVGDWAVSYWRAGGGAAADCTRCGAHTTLRAHRRTDMNRPARGLRVRCERCGEELWSSLVGIAMALPEVRAVRRRHPRTRAIERDDRGTAVVSFGDLDVGFDAVTHRLLAA